MSELKINEFRERAERGLDFPDLSVIERRGRALRRRRVATAVGGLALALVTAVAVTEMATDRGDAAPDPATQPAPAPSASWDDGVRTTVDLGEDVLLPGRSEVVYDGVVVSFDVPGESWEWWDMGLGLRRTATEADGYGAAVFFMQDVSARLRPCSADRVAALGSDPDDLVANVTPLLDLAHATVLEAPAVVTAFGGDAVHLRLQTDGGACPDRGDGPLLLRGVVNGVDLEPGLSGRHLLDLWHVVLPGPQPASILVASWDLNGTSEHEAQRQAVIDSLRIELS
jgi:hypothetical protein